MEMEQSSTLYFYFVEVLFPKPIGLISIVEFQTLVIPYLTSILYKLSMPGLSLIDPWTS